MPNRIIQYPVPLMLRKVLKDRSDGELIVLGKSFSKNLLFKEGNLVFARTDLIEERLGEILFKIGKINREQYTGITDLIKNRSERIGTILVKEHIINQRDLFFALVYQLRTIATSTFALVSGEWNFVPKVPEVPDDSSFKVGLPGIIIEGTNKITNIDYFKNKFLYKVPKLTAIPGSMKEFLSNYEIKFYSDMAQYNNLTCEKIVARLKISDDIFWKKIVLFYLLNIIDFTEAEVERDIDQNIEEILRLYDQLKSQRLDYYQVLGLKHTAAANEIKSAYFEYAKRYHPDRITSAPDSDIKEKANFVFAEINRAYETLGNPDKKNEYDGKGYKEDTQIEGFQENLAEKARFLYRKAKTLYSQKKYWEASSVMEDAVQADPAKSAYFLLLGLSQMNLPSLKRIAATNLQKAVDLEPWNVEAYAALGMLFLSENQVKRAEGFFRKVLSINSDHALARKKLDDILGTSGEAKKKSRFTLFGKPKK
jgi:tetratricopeptide (TPR) repeat protein